jgi:predicted tellurium resistance membrane protein TerC
VILTFVGTKMLGERWFEIDVLPSLAIILGVLAAAIIGSVLRPRPTTSSPANRAQTAEPGPR